MEKITGSFARPFKFGAEFAAYNVVPQAIVDGFLDKKIEMRQEIQDELGLDQVHAQRITEILAEHFGFGDLDEDGCLRYDDTTKDYLIHEYELLWRNKTWLANPVKNPSIQVTAGSPGAGKTTFLNENRQKNSIYIDPDEETLMTLDLYYDIYNDTERLAQTHTELASLIGDYGAQNFGRMVAYTYGRWGSNYISNSMLNHAAKESYNIDFGTTASGAGVPFLFLKDAPEDGVVGFVPRGYRVFFQVIDAPMDVKEASNIHRHHDGSGKFVPKKDIVGKAAALGDNFNLFPEIAALSRGHVNYWWRPEFECELDYLGTLTADEWVMFTSEEETKEFFEQYGSSMQDLLRISTAAYEQRIQDHKGPGNIL